MMLFTENIFLPSRFKFTNKIAQNVRFEDTSIMEFNELFQPNIEREPYDISKIASWNWTGVDLSTESQYKKIKNPSRTRKARDFNPKACDKSINWWLENGL